MKITACFIPALLLTESSILLYYKIYIYTRSKIQISVKVTLTLLLTSCKGMYFKLYGNFWVANLFKIVVKCFLLHKNVGVGDESASFIKSTFAVSFAVRLVLCVWKKCNFINICPQLERTPFFTWSRIRGLQFIRGTCIVW